MRVIKSEWRLPLHSGLLFILFLLVWHYKHGLQITVLKSLTGSSLMYQEVQNNRSNEGQLPALKKATVSVMEKNRSPGLRGSVYIVCAALHSQEAMRRCPIPMRSSETDNSSYREVQAEACPNSIDTMPSLWTWCVTCCKM